VFAGMTAGLLAGPSAAQTTRDGWGLSVADNSGVRTLNSTFRRLEPKVFRFQVPYDADSYPTEIQRARDMIARARALGVQQIAVTFNPSVLDGRNGVYTIRPTVQDWSRHVNAIVDQLTSGVDAWGTANEPNAGMGWLSGTGSNGAPRLAQFYLALKDKLRGSGDRLISPEFADHLDANGALIRNGPAGDTRSDVRRYVDAYVAAGGGFGDYVGWHPYSGVKHMTRVSTDDLVGAIPAGVPIWITEVAAHNDANPTPTSDAVQNQQVSWMANDPGGLAKHPRVARISYYQVQDLGEAWDTALTRIDGSPRPAWSTWCAAAHGDAPSSPACQLDEKPFVLAQQNRMDMVERGFDGAIWHRFWTPATGWTPWTSLGGSFVGDPSALSWGPGHLDVFARQADGSVWHRFLSNGTWAGWERIGAWSVTSDPVAFSWGNGHAEVFARGTDGKLIHAYFANSAWQPWSSIGDWQIAGTPAPITWGAGHADVFARGTDGHLIHTYFANSQWQPWTTIGAWQIASDPAPATWGSGHADVFARGTDGKLVHAYFASGQWQPFSALEPWQITGKPSAVATGPGQLDVFARGTDGRLIHDWYGNSQWQGWSSLGSWLIASDPVGTSTSASHIEVFAQGQDDLTDHIWADSGIWSDWMSLGAPGAP
jgi:hypothetical protein